MQQSCGYLRPRRERWSLTSFAGHIGRRLALGDATAARTQFLAERVRPGHRGGSGWRPKDTPHHRRFRRSLAAGFRCAHLPFGVSVPHFRDGSRRRLLHLGHASCIGAPATNNRCVTVPTFDVRCSRPSLPLAASPHARFGPQSADWLVDLDSYFLGFPHR